METITKSKWEIEREEEQARRSVHRSKALEVLKDLGFTHKERENEEGSSYIEGRNDQGQGIYIGFDLYRKKDKLEITGIYPINLRDSGILGYIGYKNGKDYGYQSAPEINVSINKSVPEIVKDINNRFFPLYLELLEKAKEKKRLSDEYQAKKTSIFNELACLLDITPDEYDKKNEKLSLPKSVRYGNVKLSGGDEVAFDFTCSLSVARKVIKALTHN